MHEWEMHCHKLRHLGWWKRRKSYRESRNNSKIWHAKKHLSVACLDYKEEIINEYGKKEDLFISYKCWCYRWVNTTFHMERRTAEWPSSIPIDILLAINALVKVWDWQWFSAGVLNGWVMPICFPYCIGFFILYDGKSSAMFDMMVETRADPVL